MADINNPLIPALIPLTRRVRRDVTAVKRADGVQAWTREPLTRENLARHLNGGPARGVCPILAGQSVTMVALLDFDSHGGETPWGQMSCIAAGVFDVLALAYGCEPLAFRSSGGRGIHLYLLWDEPQDARSVRHWLGQVLQLCDLRNGTGGVAAGAVEVFPKQDHVPADGFGNQFILPLAGKGELLEFEDLSVSLIPAGRALAATDWRASPGVPVVAPAPRPEAPASDTPAAWRDALAAITAGQKTKPLGYDEWRGCVFAIHYETDGAGLALAHEMSAASSKYDPAFLDTRVWPYVRDRTDGAQVTGRTLMALARDVYGWTETLDVEAFPVMADVAPAAPPSAKPAVPKSLHLCSDQRNAERLEKRHRGAIMTQAGRWFGWDGKVWAETERDIYTRALGLSKIVGQELEVERQKLDEVAPGVDVMDLKAIRALEPDARAQAEVVKGLTKWATVCESKATVESAVGLLKKLTETPAEELDADPMLLNCANGVVDLRTGEMFPHDPARKMTKIVPIDYDPAADSSLWETALEQIVGSDLVAFMQRWAGYCLTGDTTEQVFAVHYGGGSNGKSLVIEALSRICGGYAMSAPAGLVNASKIESVKDTELATLRGRRAVTAHETKEGCELREDFVKMATGGDRIPARKLYGDAFEFTPTHKLQLLTNHKPVIKGQDHGIWRRVMLIEYKSVFGDYVGQVLDTGDTVTHVRDVGLLGRLTTPEGLRGVLAWAVRGAVAWAAGRLQIPESIRAASGAYRREMDRVGQFVADCCELDPKASEPLTVGMSGLYPAYQQWCKEAGCYAVGRARFVVELGRHVRGWDGVLRNATEPKDGGGRRKVSRVPGIRLLHE